MAEADGAAGASPAGDGAAAGASGEGGGGAPDGAGAAGADAGAGGAPDWRASLGEELAGAPALKDIKDPAHLARQYVDQQAYLGQAVRIPSEHASAEDVAAFRARLKEAAPGLVEFDPNNPRDLLEQLGAPKEVDGYKVPTFENAEGMRESPLMQKFPRWAHEAGLTQSQFESVAKSFTADQVAFAAAQKAEQDKATGALKEKWGEAYDGRVSAAQAAAKATQAPAEFVEAIGKGRVRPDVVEWLYGLAETLGKEGAVIDTGGQASVGLTPAEAEMRLSEIMSNKEHAYWAAMPGSPEKEAAMEEVMRLRGIAMGSAGKVPAAHLGRAEERDAQSGMGGTLYEGRA